MDMEDYQSFILEWKILSRALRLSRVWDNSTFAILDERHMMLEKTAIPLISEEMFSTMGAKIRLGAVWSAREVFIAGLVGSFMENNHSFSQWLYSMGLDCWELDHCVLLALGFRGNEIGFMMNDKSHYNRSAVIRRKIGLSSEDGNLGIYLRKMAGNLKK